MSPCGFAAGPDSVQQARDVPTSISVPALARDIARAFRACQARGRRWFSTREYSNNMSTVEPAADIVLTEEEQSAVQELRGQLSEILDPKEETPATLQAAAHNDDTTLLRFIQARPNVEQSAVMFRESMSWRAEIDVDSIFEARQKDFESMPRKVALGEQSFYGLPVDLLVKTSL